MLDLVVHGFTTFMKDECYIDNFELGIYSHLTYAIPGDLHLDAEEVGE